MHLNVFVSQSCFLHCKGCYSYSRQEKSGQIVETENIINFLKFAFNSGIKKVTLCGGDPLTRCDIIYLLKKLKEIGFTISVDTVGSPIIKDALCDKNTKIKKINAQEIASYVDEIGIPIDGSTNEIFKYFRQTKDDIVKEQLAVCEELYKYKANICINTVAHKGNLQDAYNLAKLIQKLDYVKKWQIFQFMPLGSLGLKNRNLFEISDQEFLDFKTKILETFDKESRNKIEFKDCHYRTNAYMIIDNSGNALIPSLEEESEYSNTQIISNKIGNINNPNDWPQICKYIDKEDVNDNIKRQGLLFKKICI